MAELSAWQKSLLSGRDSELKKVQEKGENIREGIGKVTDPLYQGVLDTGDFLGSIPEKTFGYLLDGIGIGSQALGFPGSDWLAGNAYYWGDQAKEGFPNLFKVREKPVVVAEPKKDFPEFTPSVEPEELRQKLLGDYTKNFLPESEINQGIPKQLKELQQSLNKNKDIKKLYGRGFVPDDIKKQEKLAEEDATEKAFKDGLNAYMDEARGTNAPATDVKSIDEYKKVFAEATGIDISGKVDKSSALMAFGLALMQNRAGKGFNIGRMLGEVGKAGEVALPKLEEAKKQAKANSLAAGKYALEAKSSDEAIARAAKEKGMIRQRYYVVPKTADGDSSPSSFLANLDNGSLQELNPYELDALYNQEGFDDKYNVFPASMYDKIVEETIGQKDVKDWYQSTNTDVLLFNGADDDLSFKVQLPDANKAPTGTAPAFVDNADTIVGKLQQMESTVDRQEKDFKVIADSLAVTGIGAGEQVMQSVVQGFRNLGFDAGGDTTPIAQIKYMLKSLQAENAADILGESGKTLSDTDRKMVAEIVGGISFTEGDEAQLARKLGRLYQKIVVTGRNNVAEGYNRLKDAGINIERKDSGDSEIYGNLSGFSSSKAENRSFIEGIETSRLQIDDDGVYNFIKTG